jgi:hypothetical protein
MPDVTIDLGDLKKLVKDCFEHDVRSRAQTAVLSRYAQKNPAGAMELAALIDAEKLQARTMTTLRYRHLLEALESASDVASSLAGFVRLGHT